MADIGQEHVGDRIELEVVGNHFIPQGHRVFAYITSTLKLQQYESGHTWGHLDEEEKDFYYKEFLKMYKWQPEKEKQFKATWNLYCVELYKKLLHKWRKRINPPTQVPSNVWAAWKIVGSRDEWKKKTETAKNNRNSEVAGPGTGVTKHTAGSRSIIEHTLKLDIMTARIAEETQADIEGEEPLTLSHDAINDIYYDVVGGMKKNCVYVLASQAKVVFPHAMSTSTGKGRLSSSSVEIQELKKENADLRARFTELEEKMREFMARMVFSQTLENPSAFPDFSSPIIDSDETQAP